MGTIDAAIYHRLALDKDIFDRLGELHRIDEGALVDHRVGIESSVRIGAFVRIISRLR